VAEREVKLAASPSFRFPDLQGVVEGLLADAQDPRPQHSVYFDTPDLRLARWGCSLRYRDVDGWTVKLPNEGTGALLVREEVRFDGHAKQPPPAAVDLLRAYVRSESVGPVTRLKTLRRTVILRDADGRPAVEVVDDEVSVMDGRRLAARFRELEVEVGDQTPPGALEHVLDRLRAAGAGEPDPTPKYVHALGPLALGTAEVHVTDLPSGATAGDVVRQALAASVIRLLRHDAVIRLDVDPEGVHQARVATRRLRSDLRTFGALLDPAWATKLRDDLAWVADKLGAARDADVLLDRLRGRVARLSGVDSRATTRFLSGLADARERARADLMAAIAEPRYVDVLDRLVAAARSPALLLEADLPAATVLPGLVRAPWKKLAKEVRGLDDPPTDEQLHRVRIRTKRVRYAAEAVSPLFGKQARELADAAAALQDVLGEHNDAVNAARWLRQSVQGARSPQASFVAGELAGLERWAADEARASWPKTWKRLSKRRLRAWL
jgi:CHAD domain-containing protein